MKLKIQDAKSSPVPKFPGLEYRKSPPRRMASVLVALTGTRCFDEILRDARRRISTQLDAYVDTTMPINTNVRRCAGIIDDSQ